MQKNKIDETIYRTSNPECPACQQKRLHKPGEWKAFHPEAGQGRSREHGSH